MPSGTTQVRANEDARDNGWLPRCSCSEMVVTADAWALGTRSSPCGHLLSNCLKRRPTPLSNDRPHVQQYEQGERSTWAGYVQVPRAALGIWAEISPGRKLRQWEVITEKLPWPAGFLAR